MKTMFVFDVFVNLWTVITVYAFYIVFILCMSVLETSVLILFTIILIIYVLFILYSTLLILDKIICPLPFYFSVTFLLIS